MTKANGKLNNKRLDKLIGYYIQARSKNHELKARHKEELKPSEDAMEVLAGEILKIFDAAGVESARTKAGTATASTHDTASCSDPNLFMDFTIEHKLFELLNRSPNATACKEYAKSHDGMMPPGVKLNVKRTVRVNSPTKELEK